MKVLNLQCAAQHSFEGWFGSEADFQSQMLANQVQCPLCGSVHIHKLPSAPRLNLSNPSAPSHPASAPAEAAATPMDLAAVQGVQAQMLQAVRHLLASTEDVGQRFTEEARKMHYGEAQARNIRGQASAQETAQLLEEGIDVLPLPVPDAFKSTLQ